MKSKISHAIITTLFLAFTTVSKAQDKPANSEQPVTVVPSIVSPVKTDSQKIKKKTKHKKVIADTAYNPYQPGAVTKPLPYNSYKEKTAPVKEGTGANILKDIITNKKNN